MGSDKFFFHYMSNIFRVRGINGMVAKKMMKNWNLSYL